MEELKKLTLKKMKLEDLIINDKIDTMRFTNADGRWKVTRTDWLNPDNTIVVHASLVHDPPLAVPVEKAFLLECDPVTLKDGILTCKVLGEEGSVIDDKFVPSEYAEKFETEIQLEKRNLKGLWILVGCLTFYIIFVK